ncbi:MAG: pyridoxamine 5'-phosphate oxidase family protein, partial [Clostridiales bacterium]|nr:pyridoxamine 5'-phosphate oxidase family protein [Clostridiales bacterium]
MRRKDREITDIAQIVELMRRCRICNLALEDEDYPYVVPLNFGISVSGDSITIYFHGAKQGKKLDLIRKNNHVAFAMYNAFDISLGSAQCACKSSIEYESVMGTGIIESVEG